MPAGRRCRSAGKHTGGVPPRRPEGIAVIFDDAASATAADDLVRRCAAAM
jgi:hypothetical protein